MDKFKAYQFRTVKSANKFQKLCSQSGIITKRTEDHEVSVYIAGAKPCVLHFADKYYLETAN